MSQCESLEVERQQIQSSPHSASKFLEPPTVRLLGLPVHQVTLEQCVALVMRSLRDERGGWVVTPNVDILRRWRRDAEFRRLTADATLHVADGMPLVWASRLQGTPLPERINGTDLVWQLAAAAAKENRSIFLLGGAPGAAKRAAKAIASEFPSLRIAGVYCPPYGFENDMDVRWQLQRHLADAKPDIVFVGLGCPKQDRLIAELRFKLPQAWWLGVGVSFSFIGGDIGRAPLWAQQCGLEWLFRLLAEPRRLLKRYLIDDLPFALRLLATSCLQRFLRGSTRRGA